MTPTIWGSIMWQILFAVAWYCKDAQITALRTILLELVPRLLPCHDCRLNFRMHKSEVTRKARGDPKNAEHAFRWLYHLKDEVNRSFTPPVASIPFKEFRARYVLHDGHILNDVDVADLLVLVAIEAKELKRDGDYLAFCTLLAPMLPVHLESILPMRLAEYGKCNVAITTIAVQTAQVVRQSRGMVQRPLKHYRDWGNV